MPDVPLTPPQVQLNADLPKVPVFIEMSVKIDQLADGQRDINNSLEKELVAQDAFKSYVQKEFTKGSAKFDKFEARIDEIEDKMDKGLEKIAHSQTALTSEIKDKKIEELTKQIDRQNERKSSITSGIIIGLVVLLFGAIVTIATDTLVESKSNAVIQGS